MKGYVVNYLRFFRAVPNGYTTKDRLLIFSTWLLMLTYPASALSQRILGRSVNVWSVIRHYTFRYRDSRFYVPGGLSAMMSLDSSEPSVKANLERIQVRDAVDIGANFGFYSVVLSHFVGPGSKVVSIEPDPVYFQYLRRNLASNSCANVIPLQVACWSSETELSLVRPTIGVALDSHVESATKRGSLQVKSRRLDSILAEHDCHPSMIKMDVEGAEVEVLRGMESTIQTEKPTVVFEARDETIAECRGFFSRYGYRVERLRDGNFLAAPAEAV